MVRCGKPAGAHHSLIRVQLRANLRSAHDTCIPTSTTLGPPRDSRPQRAPRLIPCGSRYLRLFVRRLSHISPPVACATSSSRCAARACHTHITPPPPHTHTLSPPRDSCPHVPPLPYPSRLAISPFRCAQVEPYITIIGLVTVEQQVCGEGVSHTPSPPTTTTHPRSSS